MITYCYSRLHDGAVGTSLLKMSIYVFSWQTLYFIYVLVGVVFNNLPVPCFQVSSSYTIALVFVFALRTGDLLILYLTELSPYLISLHSSVHLITSSARIHSDINVY